MKNMFAIMAVILVSACGAEIIEPSELGLKKTMGSLEEKVYDPGFYLYNPLTTDMVVFDTKVEKWIGVTESYTKDIQQAKIEFTVNYRLNSKDLIKIYKELGENWADKILSQVVIGSLKNIIGKWDAVDLVANRGQAATNIKDEITKGLSNYGVIVEDFQLVDVSFASAFEQAVESKVVAIQKAAEARNKTVEIEEQAKQRVISAKADAEAMRIKTDALKQNQSLVIYEAVQKWDGHLPKIVSGNGGSILNLSPQDLQ